MVDAFRYMNSDWLRAEDIEDDAPVDVTITGVKPGKYKKEDENEHLDVTFAEYRPPLGLNNKNLRKLVELLGRDTDDWTGKRVTLIVINVEVAGELKKAIRISDDLPRKPRRREGPRDDTPRAMRADEYDETRTRKPRRPRPDDNRPRQRRGER